MVTSAAVKRRSTGESPAKKWITSYACGAASHYTYECKEKGIKYYERGKSTTFHIAVTCPVKQREESNEKVIKSLNARRRKRALFQKRGEAQTKKKCDV